MYVSKGTLFPYLLEYWPELAHMYRENARPDAQMG